MTNRQIDRLGRAEGMETSRIGQLRGRMKFEQPHENAKGEGFAK